VASTTEHVHILYHRPPDREETFTQRLVLRTGDCIITFLEQSQLPAPVVIDGRIALENGAPAIWFTFPGQWYDIGRFHLADGSCTGVYTNLLTPVHFVGADTWQTTDLFLDMWMPRGGPPVLLDQDEFDDARRAGWITADQAAAAQREADRLLHEARAGRWPPAIVHEWTLAETRRALGLPAGTKDEERV
jgi:predicted RNA-binding protein associated with RNAse of E/G family